MVTMVTIVALLEVLRMSGNADNSHGSRSSALIYPLCPSAPRPTFALPLGSAVGFAIRKSASLSSAGKSLKYFSTLSGGA